MKTIGLITINDNMNLGNRLQNFASYIILSKYGNTTNIVRYYSCERFVHNNKAKILLKNLRVYLRLLNCLSNPFLSKRKKYLYQREYNFFLFNKRINNGIRLDKNTDYEKLQNSFDYFVVGSDQIWNPYFFKYGMEINMLGFVKDKRKKISMASSISCEKLLENQITDFRNFLPNFQKISCREQQGSDLIKEITGLDCETLIDPTLMLTKKQWEEVMKMPKIHPNRPFILLYVLGELTPEYKRIITNTSKKYNCEIVNIFDYDSPYYGCGPSEFIYLISTAKYVITDSFHGTVFSCIFDKKFKVLIRKDNVISMNSRFSNIITKLGIEGNVFVDEGADVITFYNNRYDKKKLEYEQEKYISYLDTFFA